MLGRKVLVLLIRLCALDSCHKLSFSQAEIVFMVLHSRLNAEFKAAISLQGTLQSNGLPEGIDALIPLFFNGVDESGSTLIDDNLAMTNFTVPDELTEYDDYETWAGTAVWQTINGYVW